jgi:16S rRNA (guanine527-N7)-methyltransferase
MQDREIFDGIMAEGASLHGIGLSTQAAGLMGACFEFLAGWSQRHNLVGPKEAGEIARALFLDSLLGVLALPLSGTPGLIDVGCGAGFPGLVLKIARPDIRLTLLDSSKKKIAFVREAAQHLGMEGIDFKCARAEEAGRDPAFREKFDVAVSKGVAPLPALLELCVPFAAPGGKFAAWKGINYGNEINIPGGGYRRLGAGEPEIHRFSLGLSQRDTYLLVFEKTGSTPPEYPRSFQAIRRRPVN